MTMALTQVQRSHANVAAPTDDGSALAPLSQIEAEIEAVADEVAALIRGSELQCAFEVGRLVTERLFAGDPGGWHRRGPKRLSLARLADALATRGAGNASALHLCLGAFETLEPFGDISTLKYLTRGHVRAVLPLPMDERATLLRRADEGGWSIRELKTEVQRAPRRRRLGRPRQPAFVRGVRQIVAADAPDAPAFQDLDRIAEMSPEAIESLHIALMGARARLDRLQIKLSPKKAAALRSDSDLS